MIFKYFTRGLHAFVAILFDVNVSSIFFAEFSFVMAMIPFIRLFRESKLELNYFNFYNKNIPTSTF